MACVCRVLSKQGVKVDVSVAEEIVIFDWKYPFKRNLEGEGQMCCNFLSFF